MKNRGGTAISFPKVDLHCELKVLLIDFVKPINLNRKSKNYKSLQNMAKTMTQLLTYLTYLRGRTGHETDICHICKTTHPILTKFAAYPLCMKRRSHVK